MLSIWFDLRVGDVGCGELTVSLRGGTDLERVRVTLGAYPRPRQVGGSVCRWFMLSLICISN